MAKFTTKMPATVTIAILALPTLANNQFKRNEYVSHRDHYTHSRTQRERERESNIQCQGLACTRAFGMCLTLAEGQKLDNF